MAINFNDALKTKVSDIERPKQAPIGEYRFAIKKVPAVQTLKNDLWDVCDFQCQAVEALPTVDAAELAEFGGFKNVNIRYRIMFNKEDQVTFDRSMFQLRTFLEKHVQCSNPDDALSQALNASVNKQFIGTVQWRPDQNNPEVVYAEIRNTAPVE